jgi:hypothetical protein
MALVKNFNSAIFIYTPGRSGSSFSKQLFLDAKIQSHNIHSLKPSGNIDGIINSSKNYVKQNEIYLGWLTTQKAKILTLAREPIGRCFSSYYHHFVNNRTSPKQAAKLFLSNFPHDWALNWFDTELNHFLGVDVYDNDFDKNLGYAHIDTKHSLIVMKTDIIGKNISKVVKDCWNLNIKSKPSKARNENSNMAKYKQALKSARFPKEYVDRMYNSKFAQHFFTPEEISKFKGRWTE